MMPQISFYTAQPQDDSCLLQIIDEHAYQTVFSELPAQEKKWLEHQHVTGKSGDIAYLYQDDGRLAKVIMVDKEEMRHLSLATLTQKLPKGCYRLLDPLDNEALFAWGNSQYQFDRYQKKSETLKVLEVNAEQLSWLKSELSAVFLVRDLINTPANDMGPGQLANQLEQLAQQYDGTYEEIVGDDLLKQNYPAIHTVGRAAEDAPRLACLHWGNESAPHVALVGKGVCFDSGGLDIKPAQYMRIMKKDMGGAANAIGLAALIMQRQLPVRLSVYIACVENAVSSNAFRPGDVIPMRSGLTVEIDNTDAEGRLVLADAITRACETTPDLLIDLATLTGAARVAVGTDISAMFCNQDELADELVQSAANVHDPICRLPLFAGYKSMLDSNIADLANATASSYAGAITAALFLQHFVNASVPWVHFDIMAWNLARKPNKPEGGEAMAIRALSHYLHHKYGGHKYNG